MSHSVAAVRDTMTLRPTLATGVFVSGYLVRACVHTPAFARGGLPVIARSPFFYYTFMIILLRL